MGKYIDPNDIESWPSGCDADCQADAIKFTEELVEKVLGRHFYIKSFDIEINGNDKNRIHLPLYADIVTVDHVFICGLELSNTWYAFDENSVYLDLCGSGAFQSGAGILVLAFAGSEKVLEGLFPRGFNNCRFVGTFGEPIPQPIKQAIIWLVDAINDGSFAMGGAGGLKSEKIGDYSYTKGFAALDWKEAVFTGVDKVDAVLRYYIKQKKPIIMAP